MEPHKPEWLIRTTIRATARRRRAGRDRLEETGLSPRFSFPPNWRRIAEGALAARSAIVCFWMFLSLVTNLSDATIVILPRQVTICRKLLFFSESKPLTIIREVVSLG